MRRISVLFLALMALSILSFAQDDDKYVMFENTRFVVKTDKYKEFGKAIANHNKTWHASGPQHVNIWVVTVGAHMGDIISSHGPLTFSDVDNGPSGKEHMDDWMDKIMPTIKYIKENNFWKMASKLSYNANPGQQGTPSIIEVTTYNLKPFQGYRFKALLEDVVEVYKTKEYDRSFAVYWPEFMVNPEQNIAIVRPADNYASFDEDNNFKKDFEEVHGSGSWMNFIDELRSTIDGRYDEVWELIPELSGSGE